MSLVLSAQPRRATRVNTFHPFLSNSPYFCLMKHLPLFLLVLILGMGQCTIAQSQDSFKKDIIVLTSDSLEGRLVGSPGEAKAANFISKRMTEIGLAPKGSVGFYQYFEFTPHAAPHKIQNGDQVTMGQGYVKTQTGRNVIGFWDRKGANTIVIGAHYDHLGMGDENSLWSGAPGMHRGADDNASGVAALLEIARFLKNTPAAELGDANFLFIAFSGEEKGLYGSNYFCKNPTIPAAEISCMFNMDMVGRLKPERTLAINGTGTSPFWEKNIKKINKKLPQSFELVLSQSGVGPSDHTSFYNIGIPAIHFFTGQHGEYHKPTDTENLINYDGLISITQYIEKIILKAAQESKLSFTSTKDESKQTASNFKVTLGVMPDYLYNGIGLKIDGAKEGRPGAKAGLKQGDIILKMGKYEINDIYGYMDALGKFSPGEKTDIEIKRGDQKMKLDVTFE